ncbi:hypothetical protein RND81_02G239900 [Saponaria officinalis]|uniref:Disease resistance R13L4/SHOC-2-like LRR domain-containing protein n=1 Tax=Saponaria officinalis TaxID=3572 RepID=A0AAW1MXE8_SAPOF
MKTVGVRIPQGLLGGCLELQKLACLDLTGNKNWVVELSNLTKLRKLGIIGLKFNQGKSLCSLIDNMKYLQALNVFSDSKSESIDLVHVTSPPKMLTRFYVSGPLLSLPTWINNLHGLVRIRLRWSNLHSDPFETLQLLPNLVELLLLEAFVGEQLNIASQGFQKLKILHMLDLYSLKSLFIAKGSLPVLEEMSIGESKNLQLPLDIKYLPTLKTLNIYNMPPLFISSFLPTGIYDSTLKHMSNGYCQTYTLDYSSLRASVSMKFLYFMEMMMKKKVQLWSCIHEE